MEKKFDLCLKNLLTITGVERGLRAPQPEIRIERSDGG